MSDNGALRVGDKLSGTAGEHSGHDPAHGTVVVTGKITTGSPNVYVDGVPAVRVGDITEEHDSCCGTNKGSVGGSGSSSIFINGKPAARQKDQLIQHSGSGKFITSSGTISWGD